MVENRREGGEKAKKKQKQKQKKNSSDQPEGSPISVGEKKLTLLRSIATYLANHGFSNTLEAFRSEAQLQLGEGQSVDLEDLFSTFGQSCKDAAKECSGHQEVKDSSNDSLEQKKIKIAGDDIICKHELGDDNGNKLNTLVVAKLQEKTREKKRKRNSSPDSFEEIPVETERKVHEEPDDGEKPINETHKDSKSKKNKKGKDGHSKEYSEDSKPSTEALCQSDQLNVTSKDKKKKKHKSASVTSVEVQESLQNEMKAETHVTENSGDLKPKGKMKKKQKTSAKQSDVHAKESLDGFIIDGVIKDDIDGNQEDSSKLNINKEGPASDVMTNSRNEKTEMNLYSSFKKLTDTKNGSVEPKSVKAFQRVKIDEVEFADERLQDNSYWAKGGADSGYGAKAQEVLGQVRGRDFRHEKTKKKRGSYRGGKIDLHSHSIKFNYSDED